MYTEYCIYSCTTLHIRIQYNVVYVGARDRDMSVQNPWGIGGFPPRNPQKKARCPPQLGSRNQTLPTPSLVPHGCSFVCIYHWSVEFYLSLPGEEVHPFSIQPRGNESIKNHNCVPSKQCHTRFPSQPRLSDYRC